MELSDSEGRNYFLLPQAVRANSLLIFPAGLYAINNYLKFIMQVSPSFRGLHTETPPIHL